MWRAFNQKWFQNFVGSKDIDPPVEVRSETLGNVDKKNGGALSVFKFALGGHEHRNTVVPEAFVPRMPLEGIARTAPEEAQKSKDVEL